MLILARYHWCNVSIGKPSPDDVTTTANMAYCSTSLPATTQSGEYEKVEPQYEALS